MGFMLKLLIYDSVEKLTADRLQPLAKHSHRSWCGIGESAPVQTGKDLPGSRWQTDYNDYKNSTC